MITFSDLQWLWEKLDQSLSGLGTCFPSREERLAEEERRAWDMYAATAHFSLDAHEAATLAGAKLKERRKRFGAGKGYVTIHSDVLRVALRVLGEVDWPHPDARFGPIMGIRAALEAAGLDETPAQSGVSE